VLLLQRWSNLVASSCVWLVYFWIWPQRWSIILEDARGSPQPMNFLRFARMSLSALFQCFNLKSLGYADHIYCILYHTLLTIFSYKERSTIIMLTTWKLSGMSKLHTESWHISCCMQSILHYFFSAYHSALYFVEGMGMSFADIFETMIFWQGNF